MYRQFMRLQQLSSRTISSSARRQVDNMVKEKQKLFQADNGIPVHLKGGAKDAILYRATMALTVFGSGFVVYELLNAAMPKKA
ncbi:cytochrome c oxidase subunit 7A2, mitochondrial [Oncorhynchus tshawytscha]|uniref:cytochrome c oxidase subunit 7A2, mitochondrial-like n=1 Tax=Oncorhynchus kisutch TaxID=8019 RepID=UPI00099FBFD9|nr:cytochrome c oxidase subunit 7A2, mitochondrial-like [Oncorhynchus kisutch]XP_024293422.1 cytochrome c oxidase subunit 7A2, mitochondrial [Oncorhynchus tshawytscha]XP_029544255.1 cytochrome c oxidase subunit 7A2, mitochondrial-like [Oncorhynchus nerka]XP_046164663.1 cytochrome c oxidase subunit 7A2, mitochondrial-like [Oncorhynchus gorbuscha]